jgi:SAM-dependent methyltransferase
MQSEMGVYYDEAYSSHHGIYRQPKIQSLLLPILRWVLQVRYEGNTVESYVVRCFFFPWELKWKSILRSACLENVDRIGRILDVGCGQGYFLATMRRWDFECYGCEPDPRAAQVAQQVGISVVCSDLLEAGYPDDHFDIVRFNHVLEHVHIPTAVLSEAKRVLTPRGLLVIESPNHAGMIGQIFRHSEDVPRHLYSFSPKTLRMYFEKVGLRVIRITTRTRHPHDVYSQLGRVVARNSSEIAGVLSKEAIGQFWSYKNRRRQREYMPTARFFDSIGWGSSVVATGTKD